VLLWFVATAVAAVWYVFSDPRFDYRLLIVGALLPDPIDAPFGGAGVAHSLTGAVALLTLVMVATTGRRPLRRMLLALPIGVFLHLVFDAAFALEVFWWPFTGEIGAEPLPVVARGWWNIPLELIGATLIWVGWRRARLSDPVARHEFRSSGLLRLGDRPRP
jgi:ammonia channel protein AmtB